MEKTNENYLFFEKSFNEPKQSLILEVKRFNKEDNLCYYDRTDLTGHNIDEKTLTVFYKVLNKAGFITDIKRNTYFGLYDPSRVCGIIEIHPTNEELLERELRFKK